MGEGIEKRAHIFFTFFHTEGGRERWSDEGDGGRRARAKRHGEQENQKWDVVLLPATKETSRFDLLKREGAPLDLRGGR